MSFKINNRIQATEDWARFVGRLTFLTPIFVALFCYVIFCLFTIDIALALSRQLGSSLFVWAGYAMLVFTSVTAAIFRDKITYTLRKRIVQLLFALSGTIGLLGLEAVYCHASTLGMSIPLQYVILIVSDVFGMPFLASGAVYIIESIRRRTPSEIAILSAVAIISAAVVLSLADATSSPALFGVSMIVPVGFAVSIYKAQHDNASYLLPQEFITLPDGTKVASEGKGWQETSSRLKTTYFQFGKLLFPGTVMSGIGLYLLFYLGRKTTLSDITFQLLLSFVVGSFAICALVAIFVWKRGSQAATRMSRYLFLLSLFFGILGISCALSSANQQDVVSMFAFWSFAVVFSASIVFCAQTISHFLIASTLTAGFCVCFLSIGFAIGRLLTAIPSDFGPSSNDILWLAISLAFIALSHLLFPSAQKISQIATNVANKEKAANSEEKSTRVFTMKLDGIADECALTSRERDILELLAKGRNAAVISEKCFISEGTTRTHMRNIYAKLGVHSQQELINKVEEYILQ